MKHRLLTTIAAVLLMGTASADPIHDAARNGNLAGVQAELDKGADVNAKDTYFFMDSGDGFIIPYYERTPLHEAAMEGHKEIVELLITKGADVNVKSADGTTPLHFAVRHKGIPELLIEKGADVNAKGWKGLTPLHEAASNGHKEIAEQLIAKGADVHALDDNERNSLFYAAHGGHKEVAELLIAKGGDVNAKDERGWTALHAAAYFGHKDMAELLIANGATVNAKYVDGQTPLNWAIQSIPFPKGHPEIADLLREHGGKTGEELELMPRLRFLRSPFGFTLNTVEGKTYSIESGSDLKKWNKLREIKGNGNEVKFIDVRRIYFQQHIYRVVVED
jgi:ankyrin repeat protein